MPSDSYPLMTIVGVELNTIGALDALGIVRPDEAFAIVGATRSGAVSIAVATARRALETSCLKSIPKLRWLDGS